MIHEFRSPIPLVTPCGPGYAIYVQSGNTFEDDIWCVALTNGGTLRHFTTDQLCMYHNATFGIKPHDTQETPTV